MLISSKEIPTTAQWQQMIIESSFGQLIAGEGKNTLIVPTHFNFNAQENSIEGHMDRRNPMLALLEQQENCWLSVIDDYAFIPGYWNARKGIADNLGAPTSYYGAVQLFGTVRLIKDKHNLSLLINRQIDQLQPEGGTDYTHESHTRFGPMLNAIVGWKMEIHDIRTKHKFGQIQNNDHRSGIAHKLRLRNLKGDQSVANRVLNITDN
jgi:transcriptional regulator